MLSERLAGSCVSDSHVPRSGSSGFSPEPVSFFRGRPGPCGPRGQEHLTAPHSPAAEPEGGGGSQHRRARGDKCLGRLKLSRTWFPEGLQPDLAATCAARASGDPPASGKTLRAASAAFTTTVVSHQRFSGVVAPLCNSAICPIGESCVCPKTERVRLSAVNTHGRPEHRQTQDGRVRWDVTRPDGASEQPCRPSPIP